MQYLTHAILHFRCYIKYIDMGQNHLVKMFPIVLTLYLQVTIHANDGIW